MQQKRLLTQTPVLLELFARRNAQGVLYIHADMGQGARLVLAYFYICLGTISGVTGGLIFLWAALHHKVIGVALFLGAEGFFFLLLGSRNLWLWRKLHRLTPTNVLCERFGVDAEKLKQIAVENGILPDVNVAGQDYFRLADFGDITTLLRASSQPLAAPDTLLRPAADMEVEAGEQLLRAQA